MQQQPMPKAKTPYTEPEIIPPGADWPRASRIWVSTGPHQVLASRLRGWDPSASPSLRCSSEFWLWPGWRCWSEPPSSALPQGRCSLSGGSSPASRAVRFDDRRGAKDPGAEFIAHGLSRQRIIGIGELPLDAFLRTRPDPNKAGLSARDRQFESGSLRQRVRLSGVPGTLSAKFAAVAPVWTRFGT